MSLAHTTPRRQQRSQERRRFQRVAIRGLLGRFMLADRQEYPCQVIDISPGGLNLNAPVTANVGERVVVYLEHIGRLEGKVARVHATGFCLAITATARKRDKLAAQLTWLANREALGLPEDRRHQRVVPRIQRTVVTLPSGEQQVAMLIDVSGSGAGISIEPKPEVGTRLQVGKTPCRVVRSFEGGVAVEFPRLLSELEIESDVSVPL